MPTARMGVSSAKIEAMASKYDHIDFTPPAGVRDEAARGLAWRDEFNRGGTDG